MRSRAWTFPLISRTSLPGLFLGIRVYPGHRQLKRRNGFKFRRLKALMGCLRRREVTGRELAVFVRGWVNHARHGNTYGLRRAILARAGTAA